MYRLLFTLGTSLILFISACSGQEEVLVPDNTAPPDATISDIVVESYVNRAYISVLGRKADNAEFQQAFDLLRAGNLAESDRATFVNGILGSSEYYENLFAVGRSLYLNSLDTTDIQEQILLFEIFIQEPGNADIVDLLREEQARMELILDIPGELASGAISLPEAHQRMVYNYLYDQINMGTQNFVISLFQNFLFRYPTEAERMASETMVDGFPSQIFLETGRNKADFMRIFFASNDYAEGQVRDVYTRFLFREPDAEELSREAVAYQQSGDYESLLRTVLVSDEFVGL